MFFKLTKNPRPRTSVIKASCKEHALQNAFQMCAWEDQGLKC